MHVVHTGPGGPALEELQLLVLSAALVASRLQPEALDPEALAAAAEELRQPIEKVRAALAHAEGGPLSDVAAVAGWELRRLAGLREELAAAAPLPQELARLGAARQSALGALLGLDRALVEQGGIEAALYGVALLEQRRALAIRSVFVAFRGEMRAVVEGGESLREQLARVRTWLERMRDGRGRRRLRIADRIQVESFLARIDGAARGADGAGICRDVAAFAEVLLEVNRRAELREHDGRLAARLARELEARPLVIETIGFRRQLQLLRGRDDGLDEALEAGADGALILARLQAVRAACS